MKSLEFKMEAERAIDRIKATLWISTCLDLCLEYSKILILNENINPIIGSSLTKSLIIEYNKIFNSETRSGLSHKFLNKDSTFSQKQHRILSNLRNFGVAHSNPEFEGQVGYLFFGKMNNPGYNDSPIKTVEVPFTLHIQSQNFATLEDEVIKGFKDHFTACISICKEYIESEAQKFFELCTKNYKSISTINNSLCIDIEDSETHPPNSEKNLIKTKSLPDLSIDKVGWISKTFIHGSYKQENLIHEDDFVKIENIPHSNRYHILFKNKNSRINDSTAPKPSPAA